MRACRGSRPAARQGRRPRRTRGLAVAVTAAAALVSPAAAIAQGANPPITFNYHTGSQLYFGFGQPLELTVTEKGAVEPWAWQYSLNSQNYVGASWIRVNGPYRNVSAITISGTTPSADTTLIITVDVQDDQSLPQGYPSNPGFVLTIHVRSGTTGPTTTSTTSPATKTRTTTTTTAPGTQERPTTPPVTEERPTTTTTVVLPTFEPHPLEPCGGPLPTAARPTLASLTFPPRPSAAELRVR